MRYKGREILGQKGRFSVTEKMQGALCDNLAVVRDFAQEFVGYCGSLLKQPTVNWKQNLIKCINIWHEKKSIVMLKKLFEQHNLCLRTLRASCEETIGIGINGVHTYYQLCEQLAASKKRISVLEAKVKKQELQNSRLTLQFRSVCDAHIDGDNRAVYQKIDHEPNKYNPNKKDDYGQRTKTLQEYKDILNALYKKEYPNINWKVEMISERTGNDIKLFVGESQVSYFVDRNPPPCKARRLTNGQRDMNNLQARGSELESI